MSEKKKEETPQQPAEAGETQQTVTPATDGAPEEEKIDEALMDGLADDLEQKLNLTAGERADDDELDPELDQYFNNFMNKLNQDPDSKSAFNDMNEMMKKMFQGGGAGGLGGLAGAAGGDDDMDEKQMDDMTNTLLMQFMDKDILYEPLNCANTELTANLAKDTLDPKDREQMEAQLKIIKEIIATFDSEPDNKTKLIAQFEEMNKIGSFFDLISKYSPQHANQPNMFGGGGMGGLGGLFGGLGGAGPGGPGMPGMPGPEGGEGGAPGQPDCCLI